MLVSVCTVTFNRRPFIPMMIRCFESQDYKGDMEWIIVDDGTDPIGDLVQHLPMVKYIRLDTKHILGKKRNIMHSHCKGDILVYMDDDDYYPSERVSHAVYALTHSDALCAGSSIIHIYYHHLKKIIEFGPYGPMHATAGTFAMKKELLELTSYVEDACMAEEKHFLKNYTIPFIQLDPKKVILVVAHDHNTVDKSTLLHFNNAVKETTMKIEDFITDDILLQFFKHDVHVILKEYVAGEKMNKPDVMEWLKTEKDNAFCIKMGNKVLYKNDIISVINNQQAYIQELQKKNKELQWKVSSLVNTFQKID
jgi:glycosyltransferase involved in cell wall biosynthesis